MIRRDDGNDWLLIPQVQHAHLAAEIAAVWGNEVTPALPLADRLVPAIRHHDDGWRDWQNSPTVDPQTGFPRNFTEMPMSVATAIWSKSIDFCGASSTLDGIWVSKHFRWLAEQARESRRDDSDDRAAIETFLQKQTTLQQQWREHTAETISIDQLDALIEIGFRYVQFFDRISLWLCCAPRTEPYETEIPDAAPICLIPLAGNRVELCPYPLSVDELELSATARRIPARMYADDVELQAAISQAPSEQLEWRITR